MVFEDNRIPCLDCSTVTRARSVSDLPDNPYVTHGEDQNEVFYSDHEEESEDENQPEVERLRRLVQEENMKKVSELLYLSSQKALLFSRVRKEESSKLVDVLKVTESFMSQIAETLNDQLSHIRNLEMLEAGVHDLRRQLEGIDMSDTSAITSIYENAVNLSCALDTEAVSPRSQDLKKSLEKSSVKVEFEKAHDFLSFLKAGNDKLTLSLDTDIREKPSLFLLRYLLSHIFQDTISSLNSTFKEVLELESSSQRILSCGPLETADGATERFNSERKRESSSEISSQRSQLAPDNACISRVSKMAPIPKTGLKRNVGESNGPRCSLLKEGRKEDDASETSSQRSLQTPPTPEHPCFSGVSKIAPIPKMVFKKTVGESNRPHSFFMVQVYSQPTPISVPSITFLLRWRRSLRSEWCLSCDLIWRPRWWRTSSSYAKDCKMAGDMRGRGYSMPTRTNILEVETTRTTMAPPVAQLSRTESSWQTELL